MIDNQNRIGMINRVKKVSIIIPVYNVEKYIRRCLESVLKQTYHEIEIIIVDDCGQDQSMAIVEEIALQYPESIKIIYSEKNVGLGAARDKGMREATGEYIAFVDSDDYIKSDFIERYMQAVEKEESDIIVGGYIRATKKKEKEYLPNSQDLTYPWVNISAWTKIYKKDFLQKYSLDFCGVRRYEDEGFAYIILLSNPHITIISYAGYYYWLNKESITKSKKQNRDEIYCEYEKNVRNFIQTCKYRGQKRELLEYCIASALTANLLYNGKGTGMKRMMQLYGSYKKTLSMLCEKIDRNRYIGLKYLKSEPLKRRYAMWMVMKLRKLKIDIVLFMLVSII